MKPIAQVAAELQKLDRRPLPVRPSAGMERRDGEDSDYRRAWGTGGKAPFGRPLRAAFYQYLPESPRHTLPDPDACRVYVGQIDETLERGCWSPNEIERLRQLRRIWDRRAKGLDLRYKAHGNMPGVNNAHDRKHDRPNSARSIMEKIQAAIAESNGKVKAARQEQKFVVDPKWPLGRPNPDRRV
jgi:hypothetical protein